MTIVDIEQQAAKINALLASRKRASLESCADPQPTQRRRDDTEDPDGQDRGNAGREHGQSAFIELGGLDIRCCADASFGHGTLSTQYLEYAQRHGSQPTTTAGRARRGYFSGVTGYTYTSTNAAATGATNSGSIGDPFGG